MVRVRATCDVYVQGSYRVEGEVFEYTGPSDNHLIEVDPTTEVGKPEVKRAKPEEAVHVGAPAPQVVFDFDEPGETPVKPSHLDLFA